MRPITISPINKRRGTALIVALVAAAVLLIGTASLLISRSGGKTTSRRGMGYQTMMTAATAHARAVRHAIDSASSFTTNVSSLSVSDYQYASTSSGSGTGQIFTNSPTTVTFGTGGVTILRYWVTAGGSPVFVGPIGSSDPFYGAISYQQFVTLNATYGTPSASMLQAVLGAFVNQILTYEFRSMPVTVFSVADLNPGTGNQTPIYDGTSGAGLGRVFTSGTLVPMGSTTTVRYPIVAMNSLAGNGVQVGFNLSSYYNSSNPSIWRPVNISLYIGNSSPSGSVASNTVIALSASDVAKYSVTSLSGAVYTSDDSVLPLKVPDASATAIASDISANWLCQFKIALKPTVSCTMGSLLAGNMTAQQQLVTAFAQAKTSSPAYLITPGTSSTNYPAYPGVAYANMLSNNSIASSCYVVDLPKLIGATNGAGGLNSFFIDQAGVTNAAVVIVNPHSLPVNGVTVVSNGPLTVIDSWGSYIAGGSKNMIIAPKINVCPYASMGSLDLYTSLCLDGGGCSSVQQPSGTTVATSVAVHGGYAMWGSAGSTNIPVYIAGDQDLESGTVYPPLTPAVTAVTLATNNTH